MVLKTRAIKESDFKQIKEIHEKYYASEFSLPDFLTHFLLSFVVEKDDKIITVAGVRTIAECVAMTNKECSNYERVRALRSALQVTEFITKHHSYDQIHAFVQDLDWQRHLQRYGFRTTKGNALVLEL